MMAGKKFFSGVLGRKRVWRGVFCLSLAGMILGGGAARATPDITGAALTVSQPRTLYSRTQEYDTTAFGLSLTFASALTTAADVRWRGVLIAIVPKDASQPSAESYICLDTTNRTSGTTQGSGNLSLTSVRDHINKRSGGLHDLWIIASPEDNCDSESNSQPFQLPEAFNIVNAGITLTSASVENGSGTTNGESSRTLFLTHTITDPRSYANFWTNNAVSVRPTLSLAGKAYNGSVRGHDWTHTQFTLTNTASGESATFCTWVPYHAINPASNATFSDGNYVMGYDGYIRWTQNDLFETLPPGQYRLSLNGGYTNWSYSGDEGMRDTACTGSLVTAWDTPVEATNLITIKYAMELLACEVRPNGSGTYAPSMTVTPGQAVQVRCNFRNNTSSVSPSWDHTRYSFAANVPLTYRSGPSSGESAYNNVWRDFTLTLPASDVAVDSNLYLEANDCCGSPASPYARAPLFTLENAFIMPVFKVRYLRRLDSNPASAGNAVRWELAFNMAVDASTLDAGDFSVDALGTPAEGTIEDISCSGAVCVVTVRTKRYAAGKLRLDLLDNGTVFSIPVNNGAGGTARRPLNGAGAGSATEGEMYTIVRAVCDTTVDPAQIFCDDFERIVSDPTKPSHRPGKVGGGWEVFSTDSLCNLPGGGAYGLAAQYGCAGIDSDTPPWKDPSAWNYGSGKPANVIRANPTRSMYTRSGRVEVRSPVINLGGKDGAELRFWVRRGADYFSEDPDDWDWPLTIEYLDATGKWLLLTTVTPTYSVDNDCRPENCLLAGKEYDMRVELPQEALHANFRIRFRMLGGSGLLVNQYRYPFYNGVIGSDYWFIDNVIVRELARAPFKDAFCDNFSSGLARWSVANEGIPTNAAGLPTRQVGEATILTTNLTAGLPSPDAALFTRYGYVTATSISTDISAHTNGNVTFFLKCGSNVSARTDRSNSASANNLSPGNSSSNPLNGGREGGSFEVQYYTNAKTWATLAAVNPGNYYCETYGRGAVKPFTFPINNTVMPNANLEKFRLRFKQRGGRGAINDNDYWGIDDVCVNKTIETVDLTMKDAIKGKLLVGGKQQLAEGVNTYEIRVLNNNPPGGDVFEGALQVTDALPPGMVFYGVGTASVRDGWRCTSSASGSQETVTCEWGGEFAPGATAPSLFLEVWIPEGFNTNVKNTACVVGSVPDPDSDNNCGEWEPESDSMDEFVFTYGECSSNDKLEKVRAGAPRSGCREVNWNEPGLVATDYRSGGDYPESASDGSQTGRQKFYLTSVENYVTAELTAVTGGAQDVEFAVFCQQQGGQEAQLDGVRMSCNPPETGWSAKSLTGGTGTVSFGPYYFSFRHADPRAVLRLRKKNAIDDKKYARSRSVFKQNNAAAEEYFVVLPDHMDYTQAKCGSRNIGVSQGSLANNSGNTFCRANEPFTLGLSARTLANNCATIGSAGCSSRGSAVKGFSPEIPLEWREVNRDDSVGGKPSPDVCDYARETSAGSGAYGAECAWLNVGRLQVQAVQPSADFPNQYLFAPGVDLGEHRIVKSSVGKIGRFYPDHFQTKIGEISVMDCPLPDAGGVSGCAAAAVEPSGKFIYSGRPFTLKAQPCAFLDVSPACGRLANYHNGKYAYDVHLEAWDDAGSDSANNPNGALSPAEISPADFSGGEAETTITYTLNAGDPPPAPTKVYFRAYDGDATSRGNQEFTPILPSPEAGVTVARGRLRLSNVFGSEKSALLMEGALQYFDGAGWSVSKTDGLTKLHQDGREIIPHDVGSGSLSNTLGLCVDCQAATPTGDCEPAAAESDAETVSVNGVFKICLRSKGNKTGSVDVAVRLDGKLELAEAGNDNACLSPLIVSNYGAGSRWLRYLWGCANSAAPAADSDWGRDPSARATFGTPARDRRRLHVRELY
ncbi:MAG: DUF11 domain-containing protein [Zoogloeaceae bacterium]|jgi:hypothetical protein|nr:DUF11 domain-containing protein [Zoogloeaceae bacterium]